MRKLSVGYLVDDGYQPSLICDLIEKSKSAEHYSIDYLIVQTFAEDENLPKRAYRIIQKMEISKICHRSLLQGYFCLRKRYVCQGSQT